MTEREGCHHCYGRDPNDRCLGCGADCSDEMREYHGMEDEDDGLEQEG